MIHMKVRLIDKYKSVMTDLKDENDANEINENKWAD